MERTEYAVLTTDELVQFALSRISRTPLEVELANRLTIANDLVEQMNDSHSESAEDPVTFQEVLRGNNSRG